MIVLVIIIPIALLIACLFLGTFIVSVKSGQLDDLDTPAHRILIDDE